jgi:hypothetical protein
MPNFVAFREATTDTGAYPYSNPNASLQPWRQQALLSVHGQTQRPNGLTLLNPPCNPAARKKESPAQQMYHQKRTDKQFALMQKRSSYDHNKLVKHTDVTARYEQLVMH